MAEIRTIVFENGNVRVHIPDLTEEERAKRKEHLEKVAERFLKHVERAAD